MSWNEIVRPSVWLRRVLSGEVDMKDAPEAIRSWARLAIYQGAKELLAIPDKQKRQAALARVPALIRPYLEAEALRIWRH
jgi:hypothetical protein